MRACGQDRPESTRKWMKGAALEGHGRGHEARKDTYGVAGTCEAFCMAGGSDSYRNSLEQIFATFALSVLYGMYGLPGLEVGVALLVALPNYKPNS
jgi:hypothetical protein